MPRLELPASLAAKVALDGASALIVDDVGHYEAIACAEELLERGLAVGLGVDGAASNDTQDMMTTLRIAAYLQRAVHRRADLLGYAEMLDIACGGANSALGLSPVTGGVTVGGDAACDLGRLDATVEGKGEDGLVTLRFDLTGPALDDAIRMTHRLARVLARNTLKANLAQCCGKSTFVRIRSSLRLVAIGKTPALPVAIHRFSNTLEELIEQVLHLGA